MHIDTGLVGEVAIDVRETWQAPGESGPNVRWTGEGSGPVTGLAGMVRQLDYELRVV